MRLPTSRRPRMAVGGETSCPHWTWRPCSAARSRAVQLWRYGRLEDWPGAWRCAREARSGQVGGEGRL